MFRQELHDDNYFSRKVTKHYNCNYQRHVTYLDKETIKLAIKELPAHKTDVLQLLDICYLGHLKLKLNNALIEWQHLNQRMLNNSEF